jgi:hypothetical protein
MQMVRSTFVCRIFALITSLVFFNMSMIFIEVKGLKLDKDKATIENLAKQIAGCSSEEETDSGAADEDTTVKEIDLMGANLLSIIVSELSDITELKVLNNQGVPCCGNYEIYCPPPEA